MKPRILIDKINIDKLRSLKEDILRLDIIIPLLRFIHAENIVDMHGAGEKGVDVYFEHKDIFGHQRRFGIQTKCGDINSKSKPQNNSIMTILNQIEMAFTNGVKFGTSAKGGKIHLDGFFVITNGNVNEGAAEHIGNCRNKYSYVQIIDGGELMEIIKNKEILKKQNIRLINELVLKTK